MQRENNHRTGARRDAASSATRSTETMRLDVERRMRRGERFSDVEDVINASDLAPNEKAALWLLGWSYVHPRAQRREAIAHLDHLTAATPPAGIDRPRHLRVAR